MKSVLLFFCFFIFAFAGAKHTTILPLLSSPSIKVTQFPIPQKEKLLLTNVSLIDITMGQVIDNQWIYLSEKGVQIVSDSLNVPCFSTTQRVDCQGKYLIQGFSDMHVHIQDQNDLLLFIANGVTTVRNMSGNENVLQMKEAVKTQKIIGPHIYSSSTFLDGEEPIWPNSLVMEGQRDIAATIDSLKKLGYDMIKVYSKLLPNKYEEIVAAAKRVEMAVVGHVPFLVPLEECLLSGQKSIEHFDGYLEYDLSDSAFIRKYSPDHLQLTIDKGVWNCPTLTVYKEGLHAVALDSLYRERIGFVSSEIHTQWQKRFNNPWKSSLNKHKELLRMLDSLGGHILAGSDCGVPYTFAGFSLHDELELMQSSGLSNMQVLKAATIAPQQFFTETVHGYTGSKQNSFVLLDKNPLENIAYTKTIQAVYHQGRWFDRELLDEMLEYVRQRRSEK